MKLISLKNRIGADNRRHLSANGFSLLPLALRPRLFCLVGLVIGAIINLIMYSNFTFALDPCLDSTTPCLNVSIAGSISLDLKPVSSTGTFASSSTTDNTVSVMTNYFAGYTLSIAASTANDNALKYKENDEVLATIPSHTITTGVSATNYQDDTYARANELNNTWGYRPSKYNSVDNTTTNYYYPGPTSTINTTPTILDSTTTANPETANNYNIAIGARVGTDTPKGTYTNTFIMQVVANPVPYTIAFDKGNAEAGTVSNLPTTLDSSTRDTTVTLPGTKPTRSGYVFSGWCSEIPTTSNGLDNCGGETYYLNGSGSRAYPINQTASNTNITLYAMWQEVYNITFTAGNNIDTIIVADSSNKWEPFYITNGRSYTFSNAPAGRRYAVTVVPTANHTLDSWTSTSGSTNNLASNTLLTTIYTVGTTNETLTATGSSDTASYTAMKDFALSGCTEAGNNVTDERDGKSYTVAKFSNYCYMLSNLRLDGSTNNNTVTLKSDKSNVSADFVMPNQTTWTSSSQNHYCEARMRYVGNEYYYNWYAAKANPTTGVSSSSSCSDTTRDNASRGSICPKNWTLPTYNEITAVALWDSGNNPGMLATTGTFYSGSQRSVGSNGIWWSSTRSSNGSAYYLAFVGTSANSSSLYKSYGHSVRCRRSS